MKLDSINNVSIIGTGMIGAQYGRTVYRKWL